MKKYVLFAAAVLFAASPALAEEKTWNGTLSDAKCAAKHAKTEHAGASADDHDCVNKCVEGGGKYVSVIGSNGFFHNPADRGAATVDAAAVSRFVDALIAVASSIAAS